MTTRERTQTAPDFCTMALYDRTMPLYDRAVPLYIRARGIRTKLTVIILIAMLEVTGNFIPWKASSGYTGPFSYQFSPNQPGSYTLSSVSYSSIIMRN